MRISRTYEPEAAGIPVTIVSGLPAAAGRSFLAQLAAADAQARIAVVPGSDAGELLMQLGRDARPPVHVLVDAGPQPRRAAGYGYMPGFRSDGVIAVVDPTQLREILDDASARRIVDEQLAVANVVVLHATHTAPVGVVSDAHRLIRLASSANVVFSGVRGVAAALLLGSHVDPSAPLAQTIPWTPDYVPDSNEARGSSDGADWDAVRLDTGAVNATEFRRWADALPMSIIRGDGIVTLREMTGARQEFWRFGRHWHLRPRRAREGEGAQTHVTLIGLARVERARRSSRRRVVAVGPMESRTSDGHDATSDITHGASITGFTPSRRTQSSRQS